MADCFEAVLSTFLPRTAPAECRPSPKICESPCARICCGPWKPGGALAECIKQQLNNKTVKHSLGRDTLWLGHSRASETGWALQDEREGRGESAPPLVTFSDVSLKAGVRAFMARACMRAHLLGWGAGHGSPPFHRHIAWTSKLEFG